MSEASRKIRQIITNYFGEDCDPKVFDELETRSMRGGEWLFHQGDPGDSLYFVVRGRLQAWAGQPEKGGQIQLLGEVLPGDSVGEAGLLTGAPRTAGVKAIRDSLLMRLDKRSFEKLAARHPGMVMHIASNIATMMQRNLSGSGSSARGFSTVTLIGLHESQSVHAAMDRISGHLKEQCGALLLSKETLPGSGAPSGAVGPGGELRDELKQWLADQESEFPLLVFLCTVDDSPWTRYSLRQADIVVQFADTSRSSEPNEVEQSLLTGEQGPAGRQALVLLHATDQNISGTATWLSQRQIDFHLHVRPGHKDDLDRVVRILSGSAIGLVLGAGAVRGLAELGAYKAIREAGLPIDWVGGSSIGSIVGAAVAHDWPPEHAIDVAREAFVKGKPFSDYTLPVVSLIRGRRMVRLLRSLVDTDIEDLPIPFFCVSSNLGRGELYVHESGSLVDAIRASAALPGVLPPAVVELELAVDGAVLNNLPVDIMLQKPVDKIIAVDVSARVHRTVDYLETPSSWAVLRGRWLPFTKRHRVPSLATLILRATEIGTLQQAQHRGEQADLLINPPVRSFGMTDVSAFDPIVEAGYQEARTRLSEWLNTQPAFD